MLINVGEKHHGHIVVMPSAHRAIFCRKELREKVREKVQFFLGLNQRTRPILCRKQLPGKTSPIFSRTKSQRTRTRVYYYADMYLSKYVFIIYYNIIK